MRCNVLPDDIVTGGSLFIPAGNDSMKTDLKGDLCSTNAVSPGEIWITSPEGSIWDPSSCRNRRRTSRGRASVPLTSRSAMLMEKSLHHSLYAAVSHPSQDRGHSAGAERPVARDQKVSRYQRRADCQSAAG